jgi:hypothetical protein
VQHEAFQAAAGQFVYDLTVSFVWQRTLYLVLRTPIPSTIVRSLSACPVAQLPTSHLLTLHLSLFTLPPLAPTSNDQRHTHSQGPPHPLPLFLNPFANRNSLEPVIPVLYPTGKFPRDSGLPVNPCRRSDRCSPSPFRFGTFCRHRFVSVPRSRSRLDQVRAVLFLVFC